MFVRPLTVNLITNWFTDSIDLTFSKYQPKKFENNIYIIQKRNRFNFIRGNHGIGRMSGLQKKAMYTVLITQRSVIAD